MKSQRRGKGWIGEAWCRSGLSEGCGAITVTALGVLVRWQGWLCGLA